MATNTWAPCVLDFGKIHTTIQIPSHLVDLFGEVKLHQRQRETDIQDLEDLVAAEDNNFDLVFLKIQFLDASLSLAKHSAHHQQKYLPVIENIFWNIQSQTFNHKDVHAATRGFPHTLRKEIIRIFVAALAFLRNTVQKPPLDYIYSVSKLFESSLVGNTKVVGLFGGQGGSINYFDELIEMIEVYQDLVTPYVYVMADYLLKLSKDPRAAQYHPGGLDILEWIRRPENRPTTQELLFSQRSGCLLSLIQLTRYYLVSNLLGQSPGSMRKRFHGVAGHSQGIVAAVVVASSKSSDDFLLCSKKALGLLFWLGIYMNQISVKPRLSLGMIEDSIANGEGSPTPMITVIGLTRQQLQSHVEKVNEHLEIREHISIALENGPKFFVCQGPSQHLYSLNLIFRKLQASTQSDQSRIPHSKRQPKILSRYLPIGLAFHVPHLATFNLPEMLEDVIEQYNLTLSAHDLTIPVLSNSNGMNLCESENLTEDLILDVCVRPVNWPRCVTAFKSATHLIDFGPGGITGIGVMTNRFITGTGARVILACAWEGPNSDIGYLDEIFEEEIYFGVNWAEKYAPRLVRNRLDGKLLLDTKMSRLLEKPPIMVAGMTPTTCSTKLVSTVLNSGYHIELAGGGYHSPDLLHAKIDEILRSTQNGAGITINSLYLNAKLWSTQYALIKSLREKKYPIEGLCIAAGVPTIDKATLIISELQNAGLKHISFKPGTKETIRGVIEIARRFPEMPMLLQWTGGRGGGHHSFEDFHEPILETYADIRKYDNIVLVAGSGFGDVDDTLPYLTGEWSALLHYPAMPFDGILLGSRIMVAKESEASDEAKELMILASGVDDSNWEKTSIGTVGGITSVVSEFGEPIHKIATRGVKLWRDLDEQVFKHPKKKILTILKNMKSSLIPMLNEDSQKPWFGKKSDGSICDVNEMSYLEVLKRFTELTYHMEAQAWIDPSWRVLYKDFIIRMQERLHNTELAIYIHTDGLSKPHNTNSAIERMIPEVARQLLTTEDVHYFVLLCSRSNQKPVPFIPILDDQFQSRFKKDSLWQMENLDTIVDKDIQRSCILHGPVATRHCVIANEPVKNILDRIHNGHIEFIKNSIYQEGGVPIPIVDRLGMDLTDSPPEPKGVLIETSPNKMKITVQKPEAATNKEWCALLANRTPWLHDLLSQPFITQGSSLEANPWLNILHPRIDLVLDCELDQDQQISRMELYDSQSAGTPLLELTYKKHLISVKIWHQDEVLLLEYQYRPEMAYAPLHEDIKARKSRVNHFYSKLWKVEENALIFSSARSFHLNNQTVNGAEVLSFMNSINCDYADDFTMGQPMPMDYAIKLAWKPLIAGLFQKEVDGNLLELVHLSNSFRLLSSTEGPIKIGDSVNIHGELESIMNSSSGKTVKGKVHISRKNERIMEIESIFFLRGSYTDDENTFSSIRGQLHRLRLQKEEQLAVLFDKPWIIWDDDANVQLQEEILFQLDIDTVNHTGILFDLSVKGTVLKWNKDGHSVSLGKVKYIQKRVSKNPVIEFLNRLGALRKSTWELENGGNTIVSGNKHFSIQAPAWNQQYALASGDINPIHYNWCIAELSHLPGTITHGMWTSAAIRNLIIKYLGNSPNQMAYYNVSFDGMILPRDQLNVEVHHEGMVDGRKLFRIVAYKLSGERVISAEAEMESETTCYMFTGQGSQTIGMGMELYSKSTHAKQMWTTADEYFVKQYGLSILDIVRNNPKERKVHFHGKKGRAVRNNLIAMTYKVRNEIGVEKTVSLFPEITNQTRSYTFKSPNGLLFATQFTQPALTLMELVAFHDIKNKHLVPKNVFFAGHSLGELAALSSFAEIFSLEELLTVTFWRGLLMQSVVKRDSQNRSPYAMYAVNPSRVRDAFDISTLEVVVRTIRNISGELLEIVNYNVKNEQYVVAGNIRALNILTKTLNDLSTQEIPLDQVQLIQTVTKYQSKAKIDSYEPPQSGVATVVLRDIDIPFHSTELLSRIGEFRDILTNIIKKVDSEMLVDRYIPNLTGKPFELSKQYVEEIFKLTQNETIEQILSNWNDECLYNRDTKDHISRVLVIELLAHQFAFPVQWIESQQFLFEKAKVQRVIEIGNSPTLCTMAKKTLANNSEHIKLFCSSRDYDDILYTRAHIQSDLKPLDNVSNPTPPQANPSEQDIRSASTPISHAPISDEPIRAGDILLAILAQKFKLQRQNIDHAKTIKDLSGGKSALQNEIIGDLQLEFGNGFPEHSEDIPIEELIEQLQIGFRGTLGSNIQAQVSKLISSKMPAGLSNSAISKYLTTQYGLGKGRIESVLVFMLFDEPSSRFPSDDIARQWLSNIVDSYASAYKLNLNLPDSSSSSGASAVATINSEDFENLKVKHLKLIRKNMELHADYLNHNLQRSQVTEVEQQKLIDGLQEQLDSLLVEHGAEYIEGVRSNFDKLKVRKYTSVWNWARFDSFKLKQRILSSTFDGKLGVEEALLLSNRSTPELLTMLDFLRISLKKQADSKKLAVLDTLLDVCTKYLHAAPRYRPTFELTAPQVDVDERGSTKYTEVPRMDETSYDEYVKNMSTISSMPKDGTTSVKSSYLSVSKQRLNHWDYHPSATDDFFQSMGEIIESGLTLTNKVALVTGCSKNSIGSEIVKGLLMAGSRVIVTTSSSSRSTFQYYRSLYQQYGSNHSSLTVLPGNLASTQDISNIVEYIYDEKNGLASDIEILIPFAAFSENGRGITELDGKSELAHRLMLTNCLRLIGKIKAQKERMGTLSAPMQVILPLSPNHGTFGQDGLYGESKIGLEALLNRWKSEDLGDYLTLAGAVIGWTRGTGLMTLNNSVAPAIEELGVRTFTTREMALNILTLLHPKMLALCEVEPIIADFGGGMQYLSNLKKVTELARSRLNTQGRINAALFEERTLEKNAQHPVPIQEEAPPKVRANMKFEFPKLKTSKELLEKAHLRGMLDYDSTVVITGYGEVGPWGSSRTRWEMEAFGEFSLEGCIEMAWIMGYIKYFNGKHSSGKEYVGWVDAQSGAIVHDMDVKILYEHKILEHSGIRFMKPELANGYDPQRKEFLHEIMIDHDMEPIEVTEDEAQHFKALHGDNVEIYYDQVNSHWVARLKKGANLWVPKALRMDRLVAGLIPTGWNPTRYGLTKEITDQVDPVTLYSLVATMEALVNAGITDPYEMYQYVHVSEVGLMVGSGYGGLRSLSKVFKERFLGKSVQSDAMAEMFINATSAWINMLLLSSSGPIKVPVGACGTSVMSMEIGVDTILSGKAQVVVVGGCDDITGETSHEFANLKATNNTDHDLLCGREPGEMSRPTTSSRSGFVEGQGAGVQILMSASVALQMGTPIYAVVALTSTATDKVGRSLPACGRGILTAAREAQNGFRSPMLNLDFRKQMIEEQEESIGLWALKYLETLSIAPKNEKYAKNQIADSQTQKLFIAQEVKRRRKLALKTWNHEFWKNEPTISPLRGSLAVYGLTPDDIELISLHGTSTKANDVNETEVLNTQLSHLQRTKGNLCPVVAQKYLTGHTKGAAAAFMINGVLDIFKSGIIPGNPNADNIDPELLKCEYLVFPDRSVHTAGIKAALVTSFGFGQVGGEILLIHPDYLLGSLDESEYTRYQDTRQHRQNQYYRHWHNTLADEIPFVQIKTSPPFTPENETDVYLNPNSRVGKVSDTEEYTFASQPSENTPSTAILANALSAEVTHQSGQQVGLSVLPLSTLDLSDTANLQHMFSSSEIAYCMSRSHPLASFVGKLAAKQAVIQVISLLSKQNSSSMVSYYALNRIEIQTGLSGAPQLHLLDECSNVAGKDSIKLSISHSGNMVVAIAIFNQPNMVIN